ncbi:hypothetical protein WME75_15945 [Sorangium sp. So ce1014]|uniref:hypothetical protein n=1 Tax=Sorangium sp. So ce1014 TaxID=3133326 RepID=UPI003F5DA114
MEDNEKKIEQLRQAIDRLSERKAHLKQQRDAAKQAGDLEEVERLTREIQNTEQSAQSNADAIDKVRQKMLP